MLYQHVITFDNIDDINERFWFSFDDEFKESIKNFAYNLANISIKNKVEYDEIISKFLKDDWTIDRISEMDKNVLRVAIGEIFNGDAPAYAILDDYVTLAAEFSGEKSATFINAVLENIIKQFQVKDKDA
jgi:N utilization substance protein B